VTKGPGDGVYSGSTCKQGEIEGVVIATGVHTFFGKAAHLVDTTNQVGHFQQVTCGNGIFFFFLQSNQSNQYSQFRCRIYISIFCCHIGLDCNWELLHMFDCCGNACRACCYVSYSTSSLSSWNR